MAFFDGPSSHFLSVAQTRQQQLCPWQEDHPLALRLNNFVPNDNFPLQRLRPFRKNHRLTKMKLLQLEQYKYQANNNEELSQNKSMNMPDSSTFLKLKLKMKSIQRDETRWDNYKNSKLKLPQNIRQQLFFSTGQKENLQTVQSTKANKSKNNLSKCFTENRPMSCKMLSYKACSTLQNRPKISKSLVKVPILQYFKKPNKRKQNSLNICINQFDSKKMKKVIKCLQNLRR